MAGDLGAELGEDGWTVPGAAGAFDPALDGGGWSLISGAGGSLSGVLTEDGWVVSIGEQEAVYSLTDTDTDANEIPEDAAEDDDVTGVTLSTDLPGTVTYSLVDDAGGRFGIDASTGVPYRTASGSLAASSYAITIRAASDATTATADLTITIDVTNPEPAPALVTPPTLSGPTDNELEIVGFEFSPAGTPEYKWQTSADGGTDPADSGDTDAVLTIDQATFWRGAVRSSNDTGTSDWAYTEWIEIEGGPAIPGTEVDISSPSGNGATLATVSQGNDITGTAYRQLQDTTATDTYHFVSKAYTGLGSSQGGNFIAAIVKPFGTADAIGLNWSSGPFPMFHLSGDGSLEFGTGGIEPVGDGSYLVWMTDTSGASGTLYLHNINHDDPDDWQYPGVVGEGVLIGAVWVEHINGNSMPTMPTANYTEGDGEPADPGGGGGGEQVEPGPGSTTTADTVDWLDQFYPDRPYALNTDARTKSVGAIFPASVRTNWNIGGPENRKPGFRFRAWASGALGAVRKEWGTGASGSPAYAGGDGGLIRVRVYPDDGTGKPNYAGTLHAEFTFDPPVTAGEWNDGGTYFRDHTFTSFADLVEGQFYHVDFANIHANPAANWISTQQHTLHADSYTNFHGDDYECSPIFGSREFVMLYSTDGGSTWATYNDSYATLVPMIQMSIGGNVWGVANITAGNWQGPPDRTFLRTATNKWRTEIVPSTTRTWYGCIAAINCNVPGDLAWTLKTAGGTTLASGTITMSSADDVDGTQDSNTYKFDDWVPVWFGGGVELQAGQTYHLEYVPQGAAQFRVTATGDGRVHGFTGTTHTEIRAQHYDGSTWRYAVPYSHTSSANVTHWRELYRTS